MRRFGGVALLLALCALAATTALARTAPAPSASRCGGSLWRLKTLSDTTRRLVSLDPKTTTIGSIISRAGPGTVSARRTTPFQRQTWEVVAQIVAFRLDGGDIRLLLFDDGAYMHAVMPAPACLSKTTRNRNAILAARASFVAACGKPSLTWEPLGAVVYVGGVGFWFG